MKKLVAVICSISIIIAISLTLGCGGGGGGGSSNNGNDLFKVINTLNKNISADSATQIGVLSSDGIQLNLAKGALSDNSNVAVRQYSNDAAMARFTENFPSLASFTVVSSLYELTAKDNKSKTLTILEIPSEIEVALTEDLNTNKLYYAVVKQNGEWTLLPLQDYSPTNSSRLASNASRSIKMTFNTIYESLFIVAVTKKNATNSKLTYAENFAIFLNGSETSSQTITASYTQKFDNDIDVTLRLTLKGDVSPDKAEISITALQNGNKKISIKKSDKTYKDFDFTTAEQTGKYQTTFKLTSDLASSKLSGNTATYNFIIKAKDMKVSDMPTKLVLKACVKGSSIFYSNDMQINFEKGADQPTANIKGSAPAETEAEINQSVVIAFSQKMNTEAVEKAISIKAGNKVIEASNIKWNSAKTELTLTLKNLDVNTKHTVNISSSALSETGIPLKAFSFSFTTKKYLSGNSVTLKTPTNGATDIKTDTTIVLNFAKAVIFDTDNGSKYVTIKAEGSETVEKATYSLSNSNKTLTITFTNSLKYLTKYNIQILDGIKSEDSRYSNVEKAKFTFTTTDQPIASIKGSVPAQTEADVNQSVVIAFSQKMNTEAVEKAISIKAGNKTIEASSLKWNSAKTELTLTLKNLDVNTKHTVSISSSALSETGIPLKAFSFSFTTKKYLGSNTVSMKTPTNGATEIKTDTTIVLNFEKAVAFDTANGSKYIPITYDGSEKPEKVTYFLSNSNKTLTITFPKKLYYYTEYTIKILDGIKSEDSRYSNVEKAEFKFTTADHYIRVKYEGNGHTSGTVPVDNNLYQEADTSFTLASFGDLKKEHYYFVGWNTKADGTGEALSFVNGETLGTYAPDSDLITLYAIWKKSPVCRIVYNGNGNTSGDVPVDNNYYEMKNTVTYCESGVYTTYYPAYTSINEESTNKTIAVADCGNLKKQGFAFSHWNTKADGSGTDVEEGSIIAVTNPESVIYTDSTVIIGDKPIVIGDSRADKDKTLTLYAQWVVCEFAGGLGTENKPYLVETAEHLNKVRNYPDKCFKQIADIDLGAWLDARTDTYLYPSEEDSNSTVGWLPIANFTGIYDGNNKNIKNLYISRSDMSKVGLFSQANIIKNLKVITSDRGILAKSTVAIITGTANNIYNCYAKGTIEGSSVVSGIAGSATQIDHSCSIVSVKGNVGVSGITNYGTIKNCFSNANIITNSGSDYVAGLCSNPRGAINCYSTGSISGGGNIGGIVDFLSGHIYSNIALQKSIKGVYETGRVISPIDTSVNDSDMKNLYSWDGLDNDDNPDNEISWSGGKTTTGKNGADVAKSEFWGSSTKKSFWIDKLGWTNFDENWEFRSGYNLPQLKGLPSVPDPDYLKNAN